MFGLHLLTTAKVAALKAQGHDVAAAAASGLTTAVTVAAQHGNPIGAAMLAAATAAEATGKSGADKRADVIATVVPVIAAEAAKGGVKALEQDAVTFAGLVLEEVVASLKQTPVVQIGEALLHALGFGGSTPLVLGDAQKLAV